VLAPDKGRYAHFEGTQPKDDAAVALAEPAYANVTTDFFGGSAYPLSERTICSSATGDRLSIFGATEVQPGGLYLVKDVAGRPGRTARGQFREVVPVHRLAYSFGWEGDDEVPPGSGLVEIDLLDRDGGTLMRMTHTGLPNAVQCADHAKGWAYYLGRLGVAAAGGNPGVDRGPPGHG
jgi:hypothetical protein